MADYQTHEHDVLVIGAGGAGLRAAIEAAAAGVVGRPDLQVAARQGAHGDGRGRHRGGAGQRRRPRQLAGALRRHDARRAVRQQLAHGRAAREGSAGPRARARGVGRAVRPHAGRPHPPAQLRRPPLSAPRARRRPHRSRDDPHAPGSRDPSGIDVHMECTVLRCSRTAIASRARSATTASGDASAVSRQGRRARDGRDRPGVPITATAGNTPATALYARVPRRRRLHSQLLLVIEYARPTPPVARTMALERYSRNRPRSRS